MNTELEIRQLAYADLPQVIAIERRAFPTPWSLAMFVLELSKPSGICLAALEDGEMVGYLVCSRYDTVWHLMNVAVEPRRRRQGIATALLERLFEQADKPSEQYTLEVRTSNDVGHPPLRALRLPRRRAPPGVLPRQPRGRADHVADGGGTHHRVILAIETSCDDTCAAVVTATGEIASNVIASQGLLHARYGGVVPEIASRHHLELVDAVTADALERAGASLDEIDTRGGHARSGPDRRAARGPVVRQGAGRRARAAARARWTTCTGTWWRARSAPDPIEPPYLCLVASGGHTFLARVDDPASYTVLGQTLDDAAGEAFDKGARLLGLGYPGGPAIDRLAREGDPQAFDFPRSAPGELDFSFSGLKTSLLYAIRDLGDAAEARAADLAASYQRAIVDALVNRTRDGARARGPRAARDRRRRGGQLGAARGGGGPRRARLDPAGRALHRQRGDDRGRRALPRAARVPGLPEPGRRGAAR